MQFLTNLREYVNLYPFLFNGPSDHSAVNRIEAYAGFALPDGYRAFISEFGGGIVGPNPVYGHGPDKVSNQGEASVIATTNRFVSTGWPHVNGTLVISMDQSGNPIFMDRSGTIWVYDHDIDNLRFVANSFGQYIDICLAGLGV